ncbi:transglycosylase SLT domain-containing protein [Acidisoma cellulosilytica]|uniref:Transglycosylase SLT domain-containing protein n=1 Tax=Acidisoma cellulosilyticum TaxID=2802395 RepID=A0A963Z1K8_9PROT|nr:transglycosylase SLT domain-containing protein [Acidisoma cellulosilyticum]MCB8880190.1 transglycosylase SLT domain-containing protein [Acidisoma cellulosilyticum]
MPAINISGSKPAASTRKGRGKQTAVEDVADTFAQTSGSDGNSPSSRKARKSRVPYSAADRSAADYEQADTLRRERKTRNDQRLLDQQRKLLAEQEALQKREFRLQHFEGIYEATQANQERNREKLVKERAERSKLFQGYDAGHRDNRARDKATVDATHQRNFGGYSEANRENSQRTADSRRSHFQGYAAAWRENANRDHDTRFSGYDEAHAENDARDDHAYRNMRYDADQDNRAFDNEKARSNQGFFSRYLNRNARGIGSYMAGGRGGGLFGGVLTSLDELGPVGVAASAALGAGAATWFAPALYSRALGGLINGAQPYYDYENGLYQQGKYTGTNGGALINQLNWQGTALPGWMKRYGIGPAQAAEIAGSTGLPWTTKDQAWTIDKSILGASNNVYTGAIGQDDLTSMYSTVSRASGHGNIRQGDAAANRYFDKLGAVTKLAMTHGIDASTVSDTMKGLLASQIASGGSLNTGYLARLAAGLQASGSPLMQTAQGVLGVQQALDGAANNAGYNGTAMMNSAMLNEIDRRGGLPTSIGDLSKRFGIKVDPGDHAQAAIIQSAMTFAKQGNKLGFLTLMRPLLQGNDDFTRSSIADFSRLMGPNRIPVAATLLTGSADGASQTAAASLLYPQPTLPKTPRSDGTFPNQPFSDYLQKYADKAGVPAGLVRSLIYNVEDPSGDPNAVNKSGGGFGAIGLMQIRKPALDDLHKQGMDLDIKTPDDLKNPQNNLRAGIDYLKLVNGRNGGNWESTLEHYYGSSSPGANQAYAGLVMAGSNINYDPSQKNGLANYQNQSLEAARRDAIMAAQISQDDVTHSLQGLNSAAESATSALASMAATIRKVFGAVTAPTYHPARSINPPMTGN